MSAARSSQHPPLLVEQGPCLVAGVVTMDGSSFTTKIKTHSGLAALQLGCVALLYTGSPQTFNNTRAFDSMKRMGAASATCEQHTPPRSWGGFGKSTPLETSVAVRLSVRFFHGDRLAASLPVWAYVVPSEAMQHDVLPGRDSWMRFQDRFYRTLAPARILIGFSASSRYHSQDYRAQQRLWPANRLTLKASTYCMRVTPASHCPATIIDVDLVRSNGANAFAGCCLVNMLHAATDFLWKNEQWKTAASSSH